MIEIEAKIQQLGSVLELGRKVHENLVVSKRYTPLGKPLIFTTEDRYLYPKDTNASAMRFRIEHLASFLTEDKKDSCLLTCKTKAIVNGVEVNVEDEKTIDPANVDTLMKQYLDTGYKDIGYVKTKTGMIYKFSNGISINVEAVFAIKDGDTYPVGHYFEVEKLLPETSTDMEQSEARLLVLDTIALLGLDPTQVEPRSWKILCAEALTKEKVHE